MERSSPCAACQLFRRRCDADCFFAPYFPADDPQFAVVHKVFGASKVRKLLEGLQVNQRGEAVTSLVDEAKIRLRYPVNGSAGVISHLHYQVLEQKKMFTMAMNQVSQRQMQLGVAENNVSELRKLLGVAENNVSELRKLLGVAQAQELDPNHEADKGGKGKETFEAFGVAAGDKKPEIDKGGKGKETFEASGVVAVDKKREAAESSNAAVKRMRPTLDLNQLPSGDPNHEADKGGKGQEAFENASGETRNAKLCSQM
ncbi:hypothetical protein K1719_047408 [Acacia pycnantha]|nr:hypothetical protein K1719_047408 [Acacia pycnantha]